MDIAIASISMMVVLLIAGARPLHISLLYFGLAFVNPSLLPGLAEIGEFSVRFADLLLAAIILAVLIRASLRRRLTVSRAYSALVGPILPFLAYGGASIALTGFVHQYISQSVVASYLRLLATALFGLLLHLAIIDPKDLRLFNRVLVAVTVISMLLATIEMFEKAGTEPSLLVYGRFGGLAGIGSLGLIAGLAVLAAAILAANGGRFGHWVLLMSCGVWGLFLTKSLASAVAGVATTISYVVIHRKRAVLTHKSRSRAALILIPMLTALIALWVGRQSDLRGLVGMSGGSFAQRLMITYAGMQSLLQHPLGVGWGLSATEQVLGSPLLNETLMIRFPELPPHYFFVERMTSLHSFYTQVLVELGIAGFVLLAYGCVRTLTAAMAIAGRLPAGSVCRRSADLYSFGLLFLLVWWIATPLYGGQTESVLAVAFLACLGAIGRFSGMKLDATRSIR